MSKSSHPDKVLFPDCGLTKKDWADTTRPGGDWMLSLRPDSSPHPALLSRRHRPRTGILNKNTPEHFPDFKSGHGGAGPRGGPEDVHDVDCERPADLVYFSGQNTIEIPRRALFRSLA